MAFTRARMKSLAGAEAESHSDNDDEIDKFNRLRQDAGFDAESTSEEESEEDRIFELEENSQGNETSSADDDDDDGNGSDDDDVEDEGEDDDNDGGDDDDSGDEIGDEEQGDGLPDERAWGSKKAAFYGTDYVDEELGSDYQSDMEDAQLEEEELIRLRDKQAAVLREDDFGPIKAAKQRTFSTVKQTGELESEDEATAIPRDMTALSTTEKLEIIIKDSPELIGLLQEFKQHNEYVGLLLLVQGRGVNSQITPLGRQLIATQLRLELCYCANIAFYTAMRAQGSVSKDHPVIGQIYKLRQLIEKMKPLDDMTRDQLESLRTVDVNVEQQETATLKTRAATKKKDLKKSKAATKANQKRPKTKLNEITVVGQESEPQKKKHVIKTEKLLYQATNYSAASVSDHRASPKHMDNDYGQGEPVRPASVHQDKRAKSVWTVGPQKKRKEVSGDADIPRRKRDEDRGEIRRREPMNDQGESRKGTRAGTERNISGPEDDYYNEVVKAKLDAKKARAEKHSTASYLPLEEAEAKRGVNFQIQKNKGLTARRKANNPRVKHKRKYQKALVKRRTVVREAVAGSAGAVYGGEGTGIKKNIVKSTKLS